MRLALEMDSLNVLFNVVLSLNILAAYVTDKTSTNFIKAVFHART